MPYSNCCWAHTNFTELNICPECLDQCEWEDDAEDTDEKIEQEQINKQ